MCLFIQVVDWYRQTLTFLPVQLLRNLPFTSAQASVVPYISGAWKIAVDNHLLHHPAPTLNQLQKIKNVIPVIDNINVRNQARLLIHRYSSLLPRIVEEMCVSADRDISCYTSSSSGSSRSGGGEIA